MPAGHSDLDSALGLVSALRAEKDALRAECQELREAVVHAHSDNAALAAELASAHDAARREQEEHDRLVAEWERNLDAAEANIAALQGRVLTQEDIETMRAKVLAEVEGPNQQYCAELEGEVARFRELYHKARRDHEMLREQFDHRVKHTDQFQAEMDKLRQAEVEDLRRQVEELKALETESRLNDELRRLKRELTAAELRAMTLAEEVEELHNAKERATREFDAAMRVKDRANNDLSASVKSLGSEVDSLKVHTARLRDELSASQTAAADAKQRLHDAEKRVVTAKSDGDEAAHALRTELAACELRHTQEKTAWDREVAALREAVATADRRVELAERQVADLSDELVRKEEEAGALLHAAREEEWAKLRDAEAAKSDALARAAAAQRDATQRAEAWARRERELVAEAAAERERADAQLNERRRLERELEDARQTIAGNEPKLAAAELLREEAGGVKAELAARERELEGVRRERDDLASRLGVREKELADVQREADEQRARLRKEADDLRASYAAAVEAFEAKEAQLTGDATAMFRRFEALSARFKEYKKRSRSERKQLSEINVGLEQQLTGATEARRELDNQQRRLQRQLLDLQRRIDEYKNVVHSEGMRSGAGVLHSEGTVPAAFDPDVAAENRLKIEHLKRALNERMDAHAALYSDA